MTLEAGENSCQYCWCILFCIGHMLFTGLVICDNVILTWNPFLNLSGRKFYTGVGCTNRRKCALSSATRWRLTSAQLEGTECFQSTAAAVPTASSGLCGGSPSQLTEPLLHFLESRSCHRFLVLPTQAHSSSVLYSGCHSDLDCHQCLTTFILNTRYLTNKSNF